MGQAIGQVLPLAIVVALSPVPIIAVVLILTTPRATTNGPTFVGGSLIGLGVLGAVVLAIAGRSDAISSGQPATRVSVVKIVLGAVLLLLALREFRGRPSEGDEVGMPAWMGDRGVRPDESAGGGGGARAEPQEALLAIAAAVAIAETGIAGGQQAIAYAVSCSSGPPASARRSSCTSPWATARRRCSAV
ncbi:MAG TPA: GAP family protein [Candidatus Dormibacteraeota bacterium]